MEKGQPFRKALTWRPAGSGAEGLRSKPTQQEEKTGHQDPGGESKLPGQTGQDASGPGLKGKVRKAHLAPHREGRRSRRFQGLAHPGTGAHAHSPEHGCRHCLLDRGETRRTCGPFGVSGHPMRPRGAGRVRRVPVGRDHAFVGGFQAGCGLDRLTGSASARATAALALWTLLR